MSNRVKNTDQAWVVYGHFQNDTLVYLGSGQVHRAFQFIKREESHEAWMIEQALKNLTANFSRILFVTDDYDEARFVESRLIADHAPRYNKQNTKLTFADVKYAKKKMSEGVSLRSCARELGIAHDNLRIALKHPCSDKYYDVAI